MDGEKEREGERRREREREETIYYKKSTGLLS